MSNENCPKCWEFYWYNKIKKICSECWIIDEKTWSWSYYSENSCPKCWEYYWYNRSKRLCSECWRV